MTPKRFYKIMIVMTFLVSVVTVGAVFFSWGMAKKLSKRAYEREVYLNNFKEKINVLNTLKLNYEKNIAEIDEILYAFPKEKNADVFMVDLETFAKETGINLTIYKYVTSQNKTKNKIEVPSDLNLTQAVKQKDYYEVTFNLNAEGEYPKLLNFLKRVEGLRRLHNIKNTELVKVKRDSVPPDFTQLISDISIYFKQ